MDYPNQPLARLPAFASAVMLLVMTILAVISLLTWLPAVFNPQDPAQTLANFAANPQLVSRFVYAVTAIILLDVALGFSLYKLFPPSILAVAMGLARVLYSIAFFWALWPLWQIVWQHGDGQTLPSPQALHSAFVSFDYLWLLSLAIFGVHLVLLGGLFYQRRGWAAKLLAAACVLAGIAYVVDGVSLWLLPSMATHFADYVGWGELLVMLYLFAIAVWPTAQRA